MAHISPTASGEHKQSFNNGLTRASEIVARLIGGLAFGGGVGSVITGGTGLLPGAVVGAVLGAVAPDLLSRINKRNLNDNHKK